MENTQVETLIAKYSLEYNASNLSRRLEGSRSWLVEKEKYIAKRLLDNHNITTVVTIPEFTISYDK